MKNYLYFYFAHISQDSKNCCTKLNEEGIGTCGRGSVKILTKDVKIGGTYIFIGSLVQIFYFGFELFLEPLLNGLVDFGLPGIEFGFFMKE